MKSLEEKIEQGAISNIMGTISITKSQLSSNLNGILAEKEARIKELEEENSNLQEYLANRIPTWDGTIPQEDNFK